MLWLMYPYIRYLFTNKSTENAWKNFEKFPLLLFFLRFDQTTSFIDLKTKKMEERDLYNDSLQGIIQKSPSLFKRFVQIYFII